MSVLENVRMGGRNPSAPPTKEEVIAACRKAYAHEFITQLEDGYDTIIGNGGVDLTIGQQQVGAHPNTNDRIADNVAWWPD